MCIFVVLICLADKFEVNRSYIRFYSFCDTVLYSDNENYQNLNRRMWRCNVNFDIAVYITDIIHFIIIFIVLKVDRNLASQI